MSTKFIRPRVIQLKPVEIVLASNNREDEEYQKNNDRSNPNLCKSASSPSKSEDDTLNIKPTPLPPEMFAYFLMNPQFSKNK